MTNNASFDFEQYLLPDIVMGEHTSWNDNDGSIEQQHATDSDTLTEFLRTLSAQGPSSNNEEVLLTPSRAHPSPPSNILSWAAPAMMFPMLPANSMMCGIPLPNSNPILDASFGSSFQFPFTPSFANAYGNGDVHMLASAGSFMYPHNHGISPSGTLITEPTSPPWLATSSPSASASSPSETTMAEDNVFSDIDYQSVYISTPSPSAVSCSSSSLSNTRRLARTRASHSDGAYRPPTQIATTARPPTTFTSVAPRGTKRKIGLLELEDLSHCDHEEEEGDIDSEEEDEYQPTADSDSEGDTDVDIPSPSSLASPKGSPANVSTSTTVIQSVAKTNRSKKCSRSKPREAAGEKVFLNDGRTKAVGGFVCGMITQWKGKGGQYTTKGIRTPEVGEVCEMRTRNWSDMVRHQQNSFWHSPPGTCQICKSRLNDRPDNMSRHGPACKGPKKAKRAPAKRPTKKARK